ncbi:hypothetical protein [Fimbriiglobus ruber]|uniref:hypothetical protein n=1 Tax=Fimbriiglobus ruber TaxID=1908690 RepID=UPI001EE6A00E|nr:hypothetical protein [Fimbriiglobus ruber]
MGCIQYNDSAFRSLFPAYANTVLYPAAMTQIYWDTATRMSATAKAVLHGRHDRGPADAGLNQMTAHLLYLNAQIAAGNTPGDDRCDDRQDQRDPGTASGTERVAVLAAIEPLRAAVTRAVTGSFGGGFYVTTSVPGQAGSGSGTAGNGSQRGNPKAFETLAARLKELSGIETRVGWFPSATYEDGTPVALVASVQDSVTVRSHPARSSGRRSLRKKTTGNSTPLRVRKPS